jgi:hypothetical protein
MPFFETTSEMDTFKAAITASCSVVNISKSAPSDQLTHFS